VFFFHCISFNKKNMNWIFNNDHFVGYYKKPIPIQKIHANFSSNTGLTKAAVFDLDHTLIKPTDNKIFSKNDSDWTFFSPKIINKLKSLNNDYEIIIVTNQHGITSGKTNKDLWISKINKFALLLNIPFTILVSIQKNYYRKPNTKLWDDYIDSNYQIIKDKSFYCGDAAGLQKRNINGINLPKDFSDSDLKFALNIDIKFIHRDEFVFDVNYKEIQPNYPIDFTKLSINKYNKFIPEHQELIIMVGFPGSGKSYYVKNYLSLNYFHVSLDKYKSSNKCINLCKKKLEEGDSVVIDNTNPSIESRKKFIDIAKKLNIKIRCIFFTTDELLSFHNNHFRSKINNSKIVPKIAYNIYKKKFIEPCIKEGFYKINKIDFILENHNNLSEYYLFYF